MASAYPAAFDTLAVNLADTTASATTHAAAHNDANDAINKLERELGISPKGSFATVGGRLNAMSTCRKTADQISQSNVLAAVTDMAFPVAASADYFFEFFLAFQSTNATTTGLNLSVTGPANAYLSYDVDIAGVAADGAAANWRGSGVGVSDAVISTGVVSTISTYFAQVKGILSAPTAVGTLQLMFASEVNLSAVSIRKGAFGRMYTN